MNQIIRHLIRKTEKSAVDLARARELLNLVAHAHHEYNRAEENGAWDWGDEPIAKDLASKYELLTRFGFAELSFGLVKRRAPFGFILRSKLDGAISVVFRGTSNLEEWISNAKFEQENFLSNGALGEVHRGFHRTYTRRDRGDWGILDLNPLNDQPSIREVIEEAILNHVADDATIYITGHSLGGALATLSALHIAHLKPSAKLSLYTFASPRVGDSTFVNQFKDMACYRIANSEDRVPNLPMANTFISMLTVGITKTQIGEFLNKQFDDRLVWEHVGEPLYFSAQWGSVAANHTIPVYSKAFDSNS